MAGARGPASVANTHLIASGLMFTSCKTCQRSGAVAKTLESGPVHLSMYLSDTSSSKIRTWFWEKAHHEERRLRKPKPTGASCLSHLIVALGVG